MVYHIGPLLPSSQTTQLKPVSRSINTDTAIKPQENNPLQPKYERRKKHRRQERHTSLMDMRDGRDRRKNGQPGGLEVKV